MKCTEIRSLLAEYASGGLSPDQSSTIEAHLAGCPSCRQEAEALHRICRLLSATPAPEVRVDVPALYREAEHRERRRARRWRRAAVVLGLAALVLVVLGAVLRLEVRIDRDQFVLRWGTPPALEKPGDLPERTRPGSAAVERAEVAQLEERVRVLNDLVHALAVDVQTRDLERQEDAARLRALLEQVVRDAQRLSAATQQDLTTLTQYLDQIQKEKGANP
jgi:hypothetical protein